MLVVHITWVGGFRNVMYKYVLNKGIKASAQGLQVHRGACYIAIFELFTVYCMYIFKYL